MIVRATMTFGLVWLLMPHHPDLGLAAPAIQASDSTRAAIFARLHEVRGEIETQGTGHGHLVWDEGRGAAPQKAGRLPDEVASDTIMEKVVRAIGSRS
jgi:hypothetical protein